jgi:hypothetical protein
MKRTEKSSVAHLRFNRIYNIVIVPPGPSRPTTLPGELIMAEKLVTSARA